MSDRWHWPRALALVALVALMAGAAACGGRSGTISPWDGGPPAPDGPALADGPRRLDGPAWADGFWWPDIRPWDRGVPDACLPIPAWQVEGRYAGKWRGTLVCPGEPLADLEGKLEFKLRPAGSPAAFAVNGSMVGTVAPGLPFKANIDGKMTCTALTANLPDIVVAGGGALQMFAGSMIGTFTGPPPSFPSGSWKAAQVDGSCIASGTWDARSW